MKRRLIIPEVVQTSMMDCGPASLKAMLEGWGIPVSYGRLREACQTDVDGTSIDTLEEVGSQLGLITEQIMVPIDHVLLASANTFPALVVVMHPSGVTHFVIAWRKHGNFVQLMDPAIGRRWVTQSRFLNELYVHRLAVPAADWREWAGSAEFLNPLRERLTRLRISSATQNRLIEEATSDSTWRGLAALDATTRLLTAIVRAGAINSGAQAGRMLEAFAHNARHDDDQIALAIPSSYWSVQPLESDSDEEQLLLRGAVLVRVKGVRTGSRSVAEVDASEQAPLSPELVAALAEHPLRPMRELFRLFRKDGVLMPLALVFALMLAAGGVIFESLLFRRLLEIGNELVLSRQRLGAVGFLLLFLVALLLLDLPIVAASWNLGRRLEMRLRIAFLEKLPRLSDRYFHSRLTSDMAERAQSIHRLRMLPEIGSHLVRAAFTLVVTITAIVWLSPSSRTLSIVAAVLIVAIPVLGNLFLSEYDLRARTHAGALSRFYLGALLGLVPIRTHSAERAVRLEHEGLLVEWIRAARSVQKGVVTVEGLQLFAGFGLATLLAYNYVQNGSQIGAAVLIVFWGLSLPVIGQDIATLTRFYPAFRNITLRLLEPMGAIEEECNTERIGPTSQPATSAGVSIVLRDVNVVAAGHTILESINLTVESGAQVAIVGSSGAGKSSLFGLLLGWHRASQGQVLVDGNALEGSQLEQLRRETAWVDPSIQLWNRSLLENLRYGTNGNATATIGNVLDEAHLGRTLRQLPEGLQAVLGEGGSLLSGGEGQRVRLGRAMLRPKIRLVLLDESFRGLDRESRRTLLTHARKAWPDATLLCITHDIDATRSFERVLVVDEGKIIEDGAPAELLSQTSSRYEDLLQAEESVRKGLWSGVAWRRMQFQKGHLYEMNGKGVA